MMMSHHWRICFIQIFLNSIRKTCWSIAFLSIQVWSKMWRIMYKIVFSLIVVTKSCNKYSVYIASFKTMTKSILFSICHSIPGLPVFSSFWFGSFISISVYLQVNVFVQHKLLTKNVPQYVQKIINYKW